MTGICGAFLRVGLLCQPSCSTCGSWYLTESWGNICQRSVHERRGVATVHEDITTRDECSLVGEEKFADRAHLIRSSGPARRAEFDHAPVTGSVGTMKFVVCEWCHDDPGTGSRWMRAPRAPSGLLRLALAASWLGAWYAWSPSLNSSGAWMMGRVRSSLAGVVARMRSLFRSQCGESVARLGGDNNARAACSYHLSKLFQNKCGAIQIHPKDLLDTRLTSGNTRGVDETRNIAQQTSLVNHAPHRFGGRDVNRCCTYLESGLRERLGC